MLFLIYFTFTCCWSVGVMFWPLSAKWMVIKTDKLIFQSGPTKALQNCSTVSEHLYTYHFTPTNSTPLILCYFLICRSYQHYLFLLNAVTIRLMNPTRSLVRAYYWKRRKFLIECCSPKWERALEVILSAFLNAFVVIIYIPAALIFIFSYVYINIHLFCNLFKYLAPIYRTSNQIAFSCN